MCEQPGFWYIETDQPPVRAQNPAGILPADKDQSRPQPQKKPKVAKPSPRTEK